MIKIDSKDITEENVEAAIEELLKVKNAKSEPRKEEDIADVNKMIESGKSFGDILEHLGINPEDCDCAPEDAPEFAFVDTARPSLKAEFMTAKSIDDIEEYIHENTDAVVVVYQRKFILEKEKAPIKERGFNK